MIRGVSLVLKAESLSKSYPTPSGSLEIVSGVSLSGGEGERLVVMGPSGSGKSTLLAMLGGLEPPTSGSLCVGDVNPYDLNETNRAEFRNHNVGFVFQDHCLLESCTALDNVLLPSLADGKVDDSLVQRGQSLLERVGLENRWNHLPSELSGGERQRVAVARALLLCPKVLLADEPTGQLDSKSAVQVVELLNELVDETGSLLCVVTHDESVAERVAGCPRGRRLRLFDGHLVA